MPLGTGRPGTNEAGFGTPKEGTSFVERPAEGTETEVGKGIGRALSGILGSAGTAEMAGTDDRGTGSAGTDAPGIGSTGTGSPPSCGTGFANAGDARNTNDKRKV